jgi:hypothetical protein
MRPMAQPQVRCRPPSVVEAAEFQSRDRMAKPPACSSSMPCQRRWSTFQLVYSSVRPTMIQDESNTGGLDAAAIPTPLSAARDAIADLGLEAFVRRTNRRAITLISNPAQMREALRNDPEWQRVSTPHVPGSRPPAVIPQSLTIARPPAEARHPVHVHHGLKPDLEGLVPESAEENPLAASRSRPDRPGSTTCSPRETPAVCGPSDP